MWPTSQSNEDTATGELAVTLGDEETAVADLTLSASSSNDQGLVPDANIVLGGSGANRTVTVTPASNQNGSTTITLTVSDGTASSTDTFVLTVNAVNDAPTISDVANQVANEDTATSALAVTLEDVDANDLTLSASSNAQGLVPDANIVLGGSGASRTVTVTPASNQSGSATITLTVSDGTASSTDTFVLTVGAVNDVPTISDVANQQSNEDTATGELAVTLGDEETAVADLTLSASSSDQGLVPDANIVLGGSGASRTVTVTPASNQSGSATITLTVSDGTASSTDTFVLTVGGVNDVPTISDVANQVTNEDTATGELAVTLGDEETAVADLTLSAISSAQGLVPDVNIVLGGSGANRTVMVAPASNQNGSTTITLTVSDGTASSTDTFVLTVNAVNDAPTISDVANQVTNEDTATSALAVTLEDADANDLTLSASSSAQGLVPDANIVLGGSGTSRTVTVNPASNQSGSATITLTVSDGTASSTDTFVLTVDAVNDVPTISDVANQATNEDTATGELAVTLGDEETAVADLTLSASSSNTVLVPDANIVLGGSVANRTVTVTPASNQSGSATITLTVSDGTASSTDTFVLTVNAVNDAPTISDVNSLSTNEDTATSALGVTLEDVETAVADLTLSASSSNTVLVPDANIVLGGSGANRTVTVTPASNQNGSTTITLTVSDGTASSTDTFVLTVNEVNDAPTISDVANQVTNEDTATSALAVTLEDVDANDLTLSASSSAQGLVPDANIVLGGSGTGRTVTVTPASNQSGSATITLTVSDGTASSTDTFVLTVVSVIAEDYYVSTSGDDAGPGDFNTPWKTIQHAFDTVGSGHTVHIRGGKYHEAITSNDLQGSSINQISFRNYNEEEVIIAGTMQIPTTDWSVHAGNIYKTTLTQDIWQLFVDSDMMTAARWPNVQQDWHEPDTSSGYNPTANSYWDMDSTQARLTESSSWGHFYNDENYQLLSSLNKSIEGAMLVGYRTLVSGNHVYTEQVTHHTAGSDNFIHTTLNFPADETASQPASGARYYIEADLDLLDSPGEWFFDKDTRELYVWFKDSGSPEGRHIEGKNKDYILKLTNCENLKFNGIQFFAGAFKLDDTYDTIFEDCKFIHSSYGKRMLKVINPGDGFVTHPFAAAYNGTYGSRSPANLTWRDCEFAKYEGAGLHIRTNGGNLVENCYFHNGQIVQVVYGAVSDHKGSGTIIRRNTFHTLGLNNATKNGKDGLLEYNRVYNMHFDGDFSAFQTPVGAQHTTRHRYNWIHDSHGRNAVRFDGDPAGIRCEVDHIVAMHNMRGFRLKGDQHQIYNLTALGNIPKADITIGIEKFYGYEPADCMEFECRIIGRRGSHVYHANENSIVKNIASNSIGTWPLIPTDNAAIWHGNAISQDLTDQLRDPANLDFRPKASSDLVDNGVVIPGFTDGYNGTAPDIGAYEYGSTSYWIPGCKFDKATTPVPPDNTNTAKTDADLMWLEGKNALEHRVYFGTQSGNLPLLGTQTNNIFAPGTLDENTEYFWRIDTVTADGIITGDEWSFVCMALASIFYATEDTYVDSAHPDTNFGSSESLKLMTPKTGIITREVYVKFNPQVSGDIVAATLRFHASVLTGGVGVYPVADNSWQEDAMTWNPPNSPPAIGNVPISSEPGGSGGWYEVDVSTYFTESGTKSIALVRGAKDSNRSIQSSESTTPPELIVRYVPSTSQTNHSPYFYANTFGSTEATANIKYSGDISAEATDPDLDQVIFSKAAGPSWLIVNPDGTLSGTPLPTDVGANSFTMRVTDPSAEFSDGLMSIEVLPVNDVPTISDVSNVSTNEDTVTSALAVTLGDAETAVADLTLSASSSNTVLVPDANIVLGGSGASRTVTVTPASNQSGSATITLTVSDGTASSTDTFVLTVVGQETTVTQTLSLNAGWNLVSFYVEASDMTAATVLAPISSSLLQIKNLTSSYDPSIPSFLNTLSSLSVKDGYWLKVS